MVNVFVESAAAAVDDDGSTEKRGRRQSKRRNVHGRGNKSLIDAHTHTHTRTISFAISFYTTYCSVASIETKLDPLECRIASKKVGRDGKSRVASPQW